MGGRGCSRGGGCWAIEFIADHGFDVIVVGLLLVEKFINFGSWWVVIVDVKWFFLFCRGCYLDWVFEVTATLALLAKQGWRLLQALQSLYCRLFKAKYFSTCSFLDTTLGPNLSYIWRNILAGRKVLVSRVVWKPGVTGTTHAIWNATPSSTYSVQLGYTCLEVELQTLVEGESSCSQSHRQVYRKFWKLQLPSKVKHFLWRAYHDILTTHFNLYRRKIRDSPLYTICLQDAETIPHILWQCPLTQNTWTTTWGPFHKMKNEMDNFAQLLTSIFSRLQPEAMMEWAVISWAIWSARNQFIFEKRQKPLDLIHDMRIDLLHHYHYASTVTGL